MNPNVANKYIGTTLIVDLNEETIITVIKEKKGPNQIRKNLKGKRKRNNYLKGGTMKIRFIVSFLIVGLIRFWKCEYNQDKDCAGVEGGTVSGWNSESS